MVVGDSVPLVEVVTLNKMLEVRKQSFIEGQVACGTHSDGNVDQPDLCKGGNGGNGLDEGGCTSVR